MKQAFIAVLATAALAKRPSALKAIDQQIDTQTVENIFWATRGMRGFWTGFNRGFYHNRSLKIPEQCMSNKTTDGIEEFLDFMEFGSLDYLFNFIEDFAIVVNANIFSCGWDYIPVDIYYTIAEEDWTIYFNRISSQALSIISELTAIIDDGFIIPPNDAEDFYTLELENGHRFGDLLRSVVGFTPKNLSPYN